jgi:hypothetical protein
MARQKGDQSQGGLLISGSDGSLWFFGDDAEAPVRLPDDLKNSINPLLEREQYREFSGLPPEVQRILKERFGIPAPSGVVHVRTQRPPKP